MGANSSGKWPLFIVVDGGDGSGKDIQAKQIARYYYEKGYTNIRIRSHPAVDNSYGRNAKRALEGGGKKDYFKAALFYTLDVIRSLIKYYRHAENNILIFSRYLLGVCYLPTRFIFFGYRFFSSFLPMSDYFFFLDVTPEIARKRISKRGEREEMFEDLKRLKKMKVKMRMVTEKENWFQINGDKPVKTVWYQIKNHLSTLDSQQDYGYLQEC